MAPLLATADGELQDFVAGEFRRARQALAGATRRRIFPSLPETWRRERFLVRRLRALVSRHRRVVHLGGWEHLVAWEDSPGLWRDLADLKPQRVLLDEADRLPEAVKAPNRGDDYILKSSRFKVRVCPSGSSIIHGCAEGP